MSILIKGSQYGISLVLPATGNLTAHSYFANSKWGKDFRMEPGLIVSLPILTTRDWNPELNASSQINYSEAGEHTV